jgi:hypothetical protein
MKIKKSEESCVGVMSDEIGSLTYADPGRYNVDPNRHVQKYSH